MLLAVNDAHSRLYTGIGVYKRGVRRFCCESVVARWGAKESGDVSCPQVYARSDVKPVIAETAQWCRGLSGARLSLRT